MSAFPHAILNEYWDLIQPGMKVETYNLDSYCPVKLFWFAEVQQVEGYKGLLRWVLWSFIYKIIQNHVAHLPLILWSSNLWSHFHQNRQKSHWYSDWSSSSIFCFSRVNFFYQTARKDYLNTVDNFLEWISGSSMAILGGILGFYPRVSRFLTVEALVQFVNVFNL